MLYHVLAVKTLRQAGQKTINLISIYIRLHKDYQSN